MCPAAMQIYWNKESVYIRKELNSHRIGLVQQHVRRSIQPRSHGPFSTSSLSTSSLEVERGLWEQGCVPLFWNTNKAAVT